MAKKKIKDLTLGELRNFCYKHDCPNCPIETLVCAYKHSIYCLDLEEEIEVEEDKPQKCKDLRGCC